MDNYCSNRLIFFSHLRAELICGLLHGCPEQPLLRAKLVGLREGDC